MHSFWHDLPVCVTGGTGFLGFHLVRRLLDLGARVRVLALPPRGTTHPLSGLARVEAVFGDIRDPEIVQRAVEGCAVVFHTAGTVGVSGAALSSMMPIHVEGTRNVLRSITPGTRVVHTSSLVAVGAARNAAPVTEETPFNLDGVALPYVHAKRAAEQEALEAASRGCHVVVTNPAYLVGPEDHEPSVMGRFCVRFWKGNILLAPPGGLNLVDVRDVADGHIRAAEVGIPGRRYLLGGEDCTYPAFLELLAATANFRPRGLPQMPWTAMAVVALLAEGRGRLLGKEPYPSLGHLRLNRFLWFCRSDRARRELGYRPRPLRESLGDAYHWHAGRGMRPPRGLNRWWLRAA